MIVFLFGFGWNAALIVRFKALDLMFRFCVLLILFVVANWFMLCFLFVIGWLLILCFAGLLEFGWLLFGYRFVGFWVDRF